MNHRPTLTARLRRLTAAVVSPRLEPVLLAVTAGALTAGGIAWLADAGSLADPFWGLGTLSAVPGGGMGPVRPAARTRRRGPHRRTRARWHPGRPRVSGRCPDL
jgi:hypothetical protein